MNRRKEQDPKKKGKILYYNWPIVKFFQGGLNRRAVTGASNGGSDLHRGSGKTQQVFLEAVVVKVSHGKL